MFEIVMTADMLETGMLIRTATGTEYPIEVTREADGTIIVNADGFRIIYSLTAQQNGCGFLASYEDEWDWDEEARDAYYEAEARAEMEMEARMERYWEEGTESQHMQYLHEVEMDEARAQFPF